MIVVLRVCLLVRASLGGGVETAGSGTGRGDPRSSAVFHPIGTHGVGSLSSNRRGGRSSPCPRRETLPDAICKTPGPAFDAGFVVVVKVETVGFNRTAPELNAGGDHPVVVLHAIYTVVGQFYFCGPKHTIPQQKDAVVGSNGDTLVA